MSILQSILYSFKDTFLWLGAFFVIFSLLTKFMPCNPGQPYWRRDSLTDILYLLILPSFTRLVRIILIAGGIYLLFKGEFKENINRYLQNGFGPLATWPLWVQAAVIFIVSDIMLYWTHRWFHKKTLWRFHAIHHSPEHVDWLSTYRFHPINTWLSFTLVDSAMILVGFSPEAISLMAGFNMAYSAMVHANLNWTFGPFKYAFASPVFHRWHHTALKEGRDKNFAPTFPLLDIIFGTFYMPEGRLPEQYGVSDDMPSSFLGQMLWPFKKRP